MTSQQLCLIVAGVLKIDNAVLSSYETKRLALADGFQHAGQLFDFFEDRFPFDGKIYHWKPLQKEATL